MLFFFGCDKVIISFKCYHISDFNISPLQIESSERQAHTVLTIKDLCIDCITQAELCKDTLSANSFLCNQWFWMRSESIRLQGENWFPAAASGDRISPVCTERS